MDTLNQHSNETSFIFRSFELLKKGIRFLNFFFLAPKSNDEDLQRREFILNVVLSFTIFLFIGLNLLIIIDQIRLGSRYNGSSVTLFATFLLIFIGLYILSRLQNFKLAAYILIGLYFLAIMRGALFWGVDLPAILLSYTLIILISSIVVSTRFGIFIAVIIIVFITSVGYLQTSDIIHSNSYWRLEDFRFFDIFGYILILLFIVLISWLSNREIERSLFRARRSEEELKNERNLLELKVEERTKEIRQIQLERVGHLYRFAEFGKMSSGYFHDIINHLTTVSLYMGELRDKSFGETSEVRKHLETAYNNSKRMENFILAVRKQIQKQEVKDFFDVRDEIKQTIEVLGFKATNKKIKITFIYSKALNLYGNPLKFHQAILNLLSNAIDSYDNVLSPQTAKKQIIVDLSEQGSAIRISIEDFGSGIEPSVLDKIFEPFFTTKSFKKGTGIGLVTVKTVIEEDFKGTIKVESQLNKGSIFTIIIPCAIEEKSTERT